MIQPLFPPEATPIQTKQSRLNESSTSRNPSSSSRLFETLVSIAIETLVTPIISSTSIPKEEVSQLPKDIGIDPSVTITEVVQQQFDTQLKLFNQKVLLNLKQLHQELVENHLNQKLFKKLPLKLLFTYLNI